jgi:low temperature requirement protein LtrA
MLAVAALAVHLPDVAEGRRETGFVIAYVVLRSLVIGLYLRARRHVPQARPLIDRYVCGYGLSVLLWLGSLAFDAPLRYCLWGAGLALEYAMPVIAQRFPARCRSTPPTSRSASPCSP